MVSFRDIARHIGWNDVCKKAGITPCQSGSRLFIVCPFHADNDPSLVLNEGGTFYCFGCGRKGTFIDLYCRVTGFDEVTGQLHLCELAGIEVSNEVDITQVRRYLENYVEQGKRNFSRLDKNHPARKVCDPLTDIELVWNAPVGDKKLGFYAGVISAKGFHYFANRATFPLYDLDGQIVGLSGRKVEGFDSGLKSKYVNTPSHSVLFSKSDFLYTADTPLRKGDVVVCEGQTDVLCAQKLWGFNACATLGTALTNKHCRRLEHILGEEGRLFLAFDGDSAGQKAIMRACQFPLVRERGLVCELEGGMDIRDYALQGRQLNLDDEVNVMDWVINGFMSGVSSGVEAEKALSQVRRFVRDTGASWWWVDKADSLISSRPLPDKEEQTKNKNRSPLPTSSSFIVLSALVRHPELRKECVLIRENDQWDKAINLFASGRDIDPELEAQALAYEGSYLALGVAPREIVMRYVTEHKA